ncbi:hypothetical protein SO802_014934 [Lithocarpus litseifolius]|uniref:Uncharacterized protein n=1 Tax=Lithocarpus litseifolius TaxID=425828 RepID=A0AAW2CUF6_9ROSI
MFASKSRARIMQLKLELKTTKKSNLSMTDYLQKIKSLADSLAAATQPIPEPDLILHILGGLSPEYESFVTSVTTRLDDLSLEDLNAMLLNQEMRINNAQISFSPEPQANIANSSSCFNGCGKGHGHGRGRGRVGFTRSRNQSVANQSGARSSVICQLCN